MPPIWNAPRLLSSRYFSSIAGSTLVKIWGVIVRSRVLDNLM